MDSTESTSRLQLSRERFDYLWFLKENISSWFIDFEPFMLSTKMSRILPPTPPGTTMPIFFSFVRRRIYLSHLVNIEVSFSQFLSITWMDFHFLTNANQPFPQWFRFSHSSSRTKREKYNKRTTGISCFLWMDGINEKSQIPSESGPYIEQTTGGFCVMMIWLVL